MPTLKATFYLPLKDNEGRDLFAEISEVEDRCFIAFEGWTLAGYFKGTWRMRTGDQAIDTSAVYHVIMKSDRLQELEQILLDFKKKANQEAIYLEIEHQVDVRFL